MSESDYLPFAVPDVDDDELREIQEAVRSGWLTTGPKTRQFESQFSAIVGARHAIAVNSCTAAMHLALEAIGVAEGDEVITTPYTFASTAEVIVYLGARPVFVDIDPVTLNINPDLLEQAITNKTRAIIPVHIAGYPAEMDAIKAICANRNLRVIEDAAHAFPTRYKGTMVGSISDVTCFSFYATKTITTGEGGMICTESDEIADRCRSMSLHGISRDAWKRYSAGGNWYYEILDAGYKYNMTDIAAAMGIGQLGKWERMWLRRKQIAATYNAAFAPLQALQVPHDSAVHGHAWHLYTLRLNLDHLAIGRGEFIDALKKRNIGCSVHFIPLHVHPYYRKKYDYVPEDFPVAVREFEREISLPIYSRMSDGDVQRVIEAVTEIASKHSR